MKPGIGAVVGVVCSASAPLLVVSSIRGRTDCIYLTFSIRSPRDSPTLFPFLLPEF